MFQSKKLKHLFAQTCLAKVGSMIFGRPVYSNSRIAPISCIYRPVRRALWPIQPKRSNLQVTMCGFGVPTSAFCPSTAFLENAPVNYLFQHRLIFHLLRQKSKSRPNDEWLEIAQHMIACANDVLYLCIDGFGGRWSSFLLSRAVASHSCIGMIFNLHNYNVDDNCIGSTHNRCLILAKPGGLLQEVLLGRCPALLTCWHWSFSPTRRAPLKKGTFSSYRYYESNSQNVTPHKARGSRPQERKSSIWNHQSKNESS
jgi:hypothetical protein